MAFGLESLLPLNIPPKSPLMYCTNTHELRQSQIKLNGTTYSCANRQICECSGSAECDFNNTIFCINGTLTANVNIFCNESQSDVLLCHFGQLPIDMVSFIPTTQPVVQRKGQSSFKRLYSYFMDLFGLSSGDDDTADEAAPVDEASNWIPHALDIPPEPITTPEPHIYLVKSNDNKAMWHYYRSLSDIYLRSEKLNVPMSSFERNNVRSFTITEYNSMKANGEVVDF